MCGLTLVELLVALAVLVTVSTSTLIIFRGVTRAWRTGSLKTERYQQARLFFDLFERELSSCVTNPKFPMLGVNADQGTPLHAGSVADELFFVGALPGRNGFIERGYWVNAAHEFMCHDGEPADGDYLTGESEVCGRDVSRFDVSYFDGTQWSDQWNGDPNGKLPKAIHIVLTVGQERPETFETMINVPAS